MKVFDGEPNQVVVKKVIHKKAVEARILSETIKQDFERHQMWKIFCVQTAPLRERKGTTQLCDMCTAIVDGIVDGVCSVVDLHSEPVANETLTVDVVERNFTNLLSSHVIACNQPPDTILMYDVLSHPRFR